MMYDILLAWLVVAVVVAIFVGAMIGFGARR